MESPIEQVRKKIIILSLMRDAIKEVSPTYVFRSYQHRDDLYAAIITTLEGLEDELEELEDKEAASGEAKEEGQVE